MKKTFFVWHCDLFILYFHFLSPSLHNLNVVTYFDPCSIIPLVALNGYSVLWQRFFFFNMEVF